MLTGVSSVGRRDFEIRLCKRSSVMDTGGDPYFLILIDWQGLSFYGRMGR
jgi:hypothetical protein